MIVIIAKSGTCLLTLSNIRFYSVDGFEVTHEVFDNSNLGNSKISYCRR